MHALTIAATPVTQLDGLYSLNDLHKASGGEARHEPNRFMRLDQTQALVEELSCPEMGSLNSQPESSADSRSNPVKTVLGKGKKQGTYVCRELVIAYAAWISPAFHLKVIRHFLDHADTQRDAATQPTALPHYITQEQAGALRAAMETRFPEGKHRPYAWSRFSNHFKLAPSQKGERAYRIVLEGQLEQERQNERRWAAREREAREHRNAARRAIERHFNAIQELRDRI